MVAVVVARNPNDAMVWCGGIYVLRDSGVRPSVLCWNVWQESVFSRCELVFTFHLASREIL